MSRSLLKPWFVAVLGVFALNGCIDNGADPATNTTEQDIAPPPPMNLMANIVSCHEVDLTWDPVPGATLYIIQRGTTPGGEVSITTYSPSSTTYKDDHLTGNTTYYWDVKVNISGQGNSAASNEVSATTPACGGVTPPTGVTATASSSSRVDVSWSAVTGASKYFILQSQSGGAYAQVASVVSPTVAYTAANLQASTTYCYEIEAQTANGTSAPSSPPACATTFAAGLEAEWKFDDKTGTTATDSSGFGRNGTLANGATFSTTDRAPLYDASGHNPSSLSIPGGTSQVSVNVSTATVFRFYDPFSVSLWVKLTSTPTGPVYLMGKRASGCGTTAWEIGQDTTNQLYLRGTTFLSFGQSLPENTWTQVGVTYGSGTANLFINGVQVASGAWTAGPYNSSVPIELGDSGSCTQGGSLLEDEIRIYSVQLAGSDMAALGTPPAAPTGLTATTQTSTTISLSWTATPDATGYIIYKGTASGNETFLTSHNTTTTYKADHLLPGTQYSFQVYAVNANGLVSSASNEVLDTTNAAPAAPTNLMATVNMTDAHRINLSWTASTGAAKYAIFRSTSGGAFSQIGSVLAPAVTYQNANLASGTMYTYYVTAIDSDNVSSAASNQASATTP